MIIISWCTASVYVAVAMVSISAKFAFWPILENLISAVFKAMGDACVDPAGVIERLIANQYGADVADYYIHCPVDGAVKESGPFNNFVRQARLNIEKSEQLVAEFAALAEMHYSPKDVSHYSFSILSSTILLLSFFYLCIYFFLYNIRFSLHSTSLRDLWKPQPKTWLL